MRRWAVIFGLALGACMHVDEEPLDIREGDLVSLYILAEDSIPDEFGRLIPDHRLEFFGGCAIHPMQISERRDSGMFFSNESIHSGGASINGWGVGRSACREAGMILDSAISVFGPSEFTGPTEDYTFIRFQRLGGAMDSLRAKIDLTRDLVSRPKSSDLVAKLRKALSYR